jgi:thioredoxin 1
MQVVKFSATWCGPCKVLAPEFKKAEESRNDVTFVHLDVDIHTKAVEEFGVMGVPQVFFVKDGEIVDHFHGFRPAEQINEIINKHI